MISKRLLTIKASLAKRAGIKRAMDHGTGKGTLLFHPTHEQMVPRISYQKNESCIQCHKSFFHVEKILSGRQGTLDYQEGNYFTEDRCVYTAWNLGATPGLW